jgi:putative membrane protein (TIGR04086 family)
MFLSILIAAMWVGRKIESNFILHGFLVGIVAIVYYVLINLPDTISGQSDMNNFIAALIGHPPKLLGGIVGGYIAGKLKA